MGDVGGIAQAGATGIAAGLQYKAAGDALNFQKNIFNQEQNNSAPYRATGQNALSQLSGMGNFVAPTAAQAQNAPGYQFQLQQGLGALSNKLVAGGLTGGNAGTALEQYAQGLASTDYNNVFNQALQGYDTNAGRLSNIANMGLEATGLTNAGAQNFSNSAANLMTQQGNALAGGLVGGVQQYNAGQMTQAYLNSQGYGGGGGYGGYSSGTPGAESGTILTGDQAID